MVRGTIHTAGTKCSHGYEQPDVAYDVLDRSLSILDGGVPACWGRERVPGAGQSRDGAGTGPGDTR